MWWLCYEELSSDDISVTPLVSLFLIFIGKLFIFSIIYFSHLWHLILLFQRNVLLFLVFIKLIKENVCEIILTQCSDHCIILSCDRSIASLFQRVQSNTSSFKFLYHFFSLRLFSGCVHLLYHLFCHSGFLKPVCFRR